jgi:hypothetical protein
MEMLAALGVFPRDLGQLRIEIDVRQIADRLVRVFEENDMPPEITSAILDAISPVPQASNGSSSRQLPAISAAA